VNVPFLPYTDKKTQSAVKNIIIFDRTLEEKD